MEETGGVMDGEARLVVVDAANVVGSRPDGWWRDRAGAARRLIAKLVEYQARAGGGSRADDELLGGGESRSRGGGEGASGGGAESVGVVVVLEGAARAAVDGAAGVGVLGDDGRGLVAGGVRVVVAEGSGDDAIVGVVANAVEEDGGRPITVVTADRGLRERVEALGAVTVGPRWLWDRID